MVPHRIIPARASLSRELLCRDQVDEWHWWDHGQKVAQVLYEISGGSTVTVTMGQQARLSLNGLHDMLTSTLDHSVCRHIWLTNCHSSAPK